MTDKSRVEAVARAIDPDAFRWMGTSFHSASALQAAYEKAKIAIAANDAWLAEQGVGIPTLPATKMELEAFYRGKAMDLAEELVDEALARRGIRLGSPSPEDTDR